MYMPAESPTRGTLLGARPKKDASSSADALLLAMHILDTTVVSK
jgi:hypothetical protein